MLKTQMHTQKKSRMSTMPTKAFGLIHFEIPWFASKMPVASAFADRRAIISIDAMVEEDFILSILVISINYNSSVSKLI